jgi:hypothetical protein
MWRMVYTWFGFTRQYRAGSWRSKPQDCATEPAQALQVMAGTKRKVSHGRKVLQVMAGAHSRAGNRQPAALESASSWVCQRLLRARQCPAHSATCAAAWCGQGKYRHEDTTAWRHRQPTGADCGDHGAAVAHGPGARHVDCKWQLACCLNRQHKGTSVVLSLLECRLRLTMGALRCCVHDLLRLCLRCPTEVQRRCSTCQSKEATAQKAALNYDIPVLIQMSQVHQLRCGLYC